MSNKNPSVLWTVDQGLEDSQKDKARDNIGVKLDSVVTDSEHSTLTFVDDIPLANGDFTVSKKKVTVDIAYNATSNNPASGTAVASAISTAINNTLNLNHTVADGEYLQAISVSNGVATFTDGTLDTAPSRDSGKAITSGAVYTALLEKQNRPDNATSGNIATFNGNKDTVDSGKCFLSGNETWTGLDTDVPTALAVQNKINDSINDGTLSITVGSAQAKTFTANQSGNTTVTIPNAVSASGTSLATGGLMTDTDKTNLDANTAARHSHTNKTILDGIDSAKVSQWDAAEPNVNADWNATSGDEQILNKPTIPTVYDGELSITVDGSTTTFSANQATNESITIPTHTHSNKSVLDGIDGNKVRQWDAAPVITDGITYGSQQAKIASGLTFAIEQVSENHKVFSTLPNDPSPSLKELGTLLPDPRLADVGQVPTLDANKKVVFSDLPVRSIADGTVPGTIKLNGNTDVSCNIVHEESNVTDWNTLVDTGLYAIKAQASNVQHSPEPGKMPCITVNADNCILQMTYGDNMHWRWRSATGTWTEWFKAMKKDTEVLVKKGDAVANYNTILAILGAGLVPVIYKEDNVGSSSHVICYYHLSRMTDCIMCFSDEDNNQKYTLTWWMDDGARCACWSDASPIRQVTKEVTYNNTNSMNDYLATVNQYDTLVLRADSDRLASIGYRNYSGSTYDYIWKGIMVPYRYYICNISSSSIPNYVTSWETVDARITYNSSDAGTQYDTIYKIMNSISADIIPELKVGDKILTNFSRTILGSNYESYTWIDDFVSPNVAYNLANINGVKKWTTYNITNSNNEISCTYSGGIISSSTTFSQILDLYKVYHSNLKVTCKFTMQSVGGSAACWYTLDNVLYTNSTFSTIKSFVWKNITLGNNCGEITCNSTNGWSINN